MIYKFLKKVLIFDFLNISIEIKMFFQFSSALKSLKVKIIELNSNPTSIDNLSPNFIQRLIIFCRSNDSFDQTLLTTLSNALSQSKHSTLLKSNSPILLALENESSFIGDSWFVFKFFIFSFEFFIYSFE